MLKENERYDLISCEAPNGDRALTVCPCYEAAGGNTVMLDNDQLYTVRAVIINCMKGSEVERLKFHTMIRDCKAIYSLVWKPEEKQAEAEEADQDA